MREDARRPLKIRRVTTENCMSAVIIRWHCAGGRVFGQGCRRWRDFVIGNFDKGRELLIWEGDLAI
jgi:hypothetical protein